MKKFSILRSLLVVLCLSLGLSAYAQDEDYFNSTWYSCDLSGTQTSWLVEKYKENFLANTPLVGERGQLIFSDECIEINCESVQMHFPVKKYKRLTETSFCVERNGDDDYFNYMEVLGTVGRVKNSFKVLLAWQDPDGNLQNTHVFICRAKTTPTVSGGKKQGSTDIAFPPQVPKL